MRRAERLLVIADLDGATLRSTWPPVSSAAWVTEMSGLNPGGHGVYDSRNLNLGHYTGHDEALADARSLTVPTLMNYLSDAGFNSVAFIDRDRCPRAPRDGSLAP